MPITTSTLSIRMKLAAMYMSWVRSASSSSGPVVCNPMTMATMVPPETISTKMSFCPETNGLRACRTGYFIKRPNSPLPLARAAVT
ncbi:hypothetical protein D3C71_1975640 [compost metagenome]